MDGPTDGFDERRMTR